MPRPTIRKGSRSIDVWFLQEKLREGGYYGGEIDGIFGAVTETAVKAFQSQNDLNPDGICGRLTWELIESGWEEDDPQDHVEPEMGEPVWLSIARTQIGMTEIAGDRDNPQIVDYHSTTSLKANDDETPWCSSFVNWCMNRATYKGTNSAAAISWLTWGKKLTAPKLGCIVVMSRSGGNHVGFYVGGDSQTVKILGGNQSNSVKIASFSRGIVKGYRWPA